jgi:hemolysin activation/secretion protein
MVKTSLHGEQGSLSPGEGKWSMKYQLGKVLASIVLYLAWITTATQAMGETLNRQDPGAISPSPLSSQESSASRRDDKERRMSDAGGKQSEPKGTSTNAPVQKQDSESEQKRPAALTLSKFNVEGNTILSQEKIDAVLDKYKGAAVQFKDVEQARVELEKAYHAAGYPTVLVNLPEQTIEQGRVTLQVIEAPSSRLR